LGMERFNRFGPIDSRGEAEKAAQVETGPSSIAVVPGAFKPPHKGHLNMVEQLAAIADKVIVVISRPLKGGRELPVSKKVVDADHAEQIWRAFLDKSPAGSKTQVIQSPAASPVGVTYDFVMKEPEPGNDLIAPEGVTVILGCGDKEDDKTRYQTIINKAREDLQIEIQVCDLSAKHSAEYLDALDNNPHIASRVPSNTKSTVDVSDFHASDMRFIIDIAAEDPVGLELLKDFVPRPEDAKAVLGILGMNPADSTRPEEDQVEEPELDADGLREMIEKSLENMLQEDFKTQKAPKGGPDSGKFQKSMKSRLSKAHATYLDMGRKDLTKHGGGFHLDRPKDGSNAFLAEEQEEIEEMSAMGAGSVEGGGSGGFNFSGEEKKRMKRQLEQEQQLRRTIRIGLKEFFDNKQKEQDNLIEYVIQEHNLRLNLRTMILSEAASEDPTVDIADSTGINTLKDLLKNSNVLSTLRNVYKTLTTDEDQKLSFRAHIIKWIQDTLAPVRLNDVKPEGEDALSEAVGVDVQGIDTDPADISKFIEADDGSEKEQPAEETEEEETMQPISGADTTGRNKAERVYPVIEKSIVDYYGELDNPEDQEMFYDYLIANTKLYFDKWDGEMSTTVEEPTNDEYEQAKQAV